MEGWDHRPLDPLKIPHLLERGSGRRWALATFGLALAARLAFLAFWESRGYAASYGHDPYPSYAQYWLGWLPDSSDVGHPPVYTFWIYLIFAAVGRPSYLAVQLLNVLLSAASCLLLARWAERAASRPIGRLAGLWTAVDPLLIFFSVQMQSEPFFIFLELLFFLALQGIGGAPRPGPVLALGLLGGLVTATRSVFLFYPAFLAAALWLHKRRSLVWALLLVGWAIPPTAWGLRNLAKYGQFIPLAANGGWNLWEGFTADREEVRRRPAEMAAELKAQGIDSDKDLKAAGDYFSRKTKRFILERPGEALGIVARKFLLYWRPWPYEPHSRPIRTVLGAYFLILFFFAAAGTALSWREASFAPVLAFLVNLSLMHSVFFTSLRYRSPLEPFLCALAAAGLYRLLNSSSRPQT